LEIFPHYADTKITVVPLASRYQYDSSLVKPENLAALTSKKFWLSVGTIEPRKNQKFLLQAYAQVKTDQRRSGEKMFPLVLVGGIGWMMDDFEEILTDLDLKEDIIWLGYSSEDTVQWLYQNCFCFIYPSLFEGFGLPVLEAMSCAAPIITSNSSSIPEITGKDSALLIDPTRVESLVDAMKACVENKINLLELVKKAMERSKIFSWEKSAEKVLDVYRRL
jgi:glycosyltransferase involved in cell wall biosynthesis